MSITGSLRLLGDGISGMLSDTLAGCSFTLFAGILVTFIKEVLVILEISRRADRALAAIGTLQALSEPSGAESVACLFTATRLVCFVAKAFGFSEAD